MKTFKPLAALYAPYPLSDRITLYWDSQAAFYIGVFSGLAMPLVGIVGRKLGMDSGQFAIMNACMSVGFLLNLWFGHISEKGDKAALVFWPALVSRLAVAFAAFSSGPVSFLLIFSFYNFVSVLSSPAYSSIMRSNYSEANRGMLMGNIRIFLQIIAAVSAAAAGWFMHVYPSGYRVLFPVSAAFGIAGAFAFFQIKPRRKHPTADTAQAGSLPGQSFRESLRSILADKAFLLYMALIFFIGFPDKIVIPLEPIRFVDELRMDYAAAGLIQGTIPFAANILGYLFYSRALKRFNPFLLIFLSVCLAVVRTMSIALATNPLHLMPGVFISALGNPGWDLLPLFTVVYFSGPDRLALYMGVYMALLGLRSLLGPILGSLLYETFKISLPGLYWVVFVLQCAGIVLFVLYLKRYRPHRMT